MLFFRCHDTRLPRVRLAHITSKKTFARASEVLNALVFLNNLAEKSSSDAESVFEWATSLLAKILPELNKSRQKKLSFVLEQLELLQKDPYGRRYSSFLLSCAVMWQSTFRPCTVNCCPKNCFLYQL
jgi:hypothetical protein